MSADLDMDLLCHRIGLLGREKQPNNQYSSVTNETDFVFLFLCSREKINDFKMFSFLLGEAFTPYCKEVSGEST